MISPSTNPNWIGSSPVSSLPLKRPRFLPETATLSECSEVMRTEKETFLLLNNDREVTVGIFTERDMVLCYWSPEITDSTPVMAVMNRKFVTIDEEVSLREAVDLLASSEISQAPVIGKGGAVKGVLAVEQLLDNLRKAFPRELLNLAPANHLHQQRAGG